jgi:hypothetical protein
MKRSLRNLLALSALLLASTGCRGSGTTIQSTSSEDDGGKSSSWAHIADGEGRFECRASATGNCNYVLYVQQCAPDAPLAGCSARVIRSFTLAAGQSRQVQGLPAQVRLCQDHHAMPVAPDCAR